MEKSSWRVLFHKGDYYIGDPLFLCYHVDKNFEQYQPQYGDYTDEEFYHLIANEYTEYLKYITVSNTLGLMKRGIRDRLKWYKSVKFGDVSVEVFGGHREPEEGRDIPYGFDNAIYRDSKPLPSTRPTQNMEWIQHYENYHNTLMKTKFYPWKDSLSYNKRVVKIEHSAKDFMKGFRIKVLEKEDIDPRQLTLLISRVAHPKEWIRSVFVKPTRRNPSLFDLATTNRYDKFMTKSYLDIVDKLRIDLQSEVKWNPFDPYRRIPVTESDMRYTFVVRKVNTWYDPIRKKVQNIDGYALKVFPPYTGYAQYDFRTDSFNVDLDEFMEYYHKHKLFEIDMSFYPFTTRMPIKSGDTIEMIIPKKGYERDVLDEYFPDIDSNDFNKVDNNTKYVDDWTETVDSVTLIKYDDDILSTTEWYVVNRNRIQSIKLDNYKSKSSNLNTLVKDYFTSIGLSLVSNKDN